MKNLKYSALLAFGCLLASFQVLYAQTDGLSREEWQRQMKTEELKISAYVNEQLLNIAQNERIKQSFLTSENYHPEEMKEANMPTFWDNYLKSYYREQYLKLHPEVVKVYNPGRVSAPEPAKAALFNVICFDGDFETGSLLSYNGYQTFSYSTGECSFVPTTSVAYAGVPWPPTSFPDDFMLTNNVPDPLVPAINQTHNGSHHAMRINAPTPCFNYNRGVDMLQKTFSSPFSGTTKLNFSYALVMQDPSHNLPIPYNPFFLARVLDNTGNEVARFCKRADASDPFFQSTILTTCGGRMDPGVYRDWDCASLEFSIQAHMTYTLEFFVADCGGGAHFAYAYVDDICADVCIPKAIPINLNCVPGFNGTNYGSNLSWDPVPGAVSYLVEIHRDHSLCCGTDPSAPVAMTTLSVTGTSVFVVENCFLWTVTAVMADGSLSIKSEPQCSCKSIPAPINLRCNPIINGPYYGSILAWDPIPGAVSYIVTIHEKDPLCCTPDPLSPSYLYDLSVPGTTTSVIDVVPHCFSWSVVAVMADGSLSKRSESMCSCTPGGPPPYDLRCDPDGPGSKLSWGPVPGAVYYKVILTAYDPACCAPNPLHPHAYVSEWHVTGTTVTVPSSFADCFSWKVVGVMPDSLLTVVSEVKCSCGVSISFMEEDHSGNSGTMNQSNMLVTAVPNPASEYVKFTVSNKQERIENLTLHLFDLSGRELLSKPLDQNGKVQIDVRPYLMGVYVYEIRSKEKTVYKDKILIEKP